MLRSFIWLNTQSVNLPPSTWRMCRFDELVVERCIRNRECTPPTVGQQQEIQVLAGTKLQALVVRKLQFQAHHIVRQVVDRMYPHRQQ